MLWKVPRMWEGGTCVILGGGPSILQQFDVPANIIQDVYLGRQKPSAYSPYLEAIHDMHVIGVNVAYKIGPWIDVMFFGDDATWDEEKQGLKNFPGLVVSCATGISQVPRVKWLKRDFKKKFGIATDPSTVCWNNNSGCAAINFAVNAGVKRIILLGFDMTLDTQQNQHWHKFYASNLNTVHQTMKKHMSCLPQLKADLDALGVEVINASPESKIECFAKVNFKDIKL